MVGSAMWVCLGEAKIQPTDDASKLLGVPSGESANEEGDGDVHVKLGPGCGSDGARRPSVSAWRPILRASVSSRGMSLWGAASAFNRSHKPRIIARHVQDRWASGSRVFQCLPFAVRDPVTTLAEQDQRDGGFNREVFFSHCGAMSHEAARPRHDARLTTRRVGARLPCQSKGCQVRPGTRDLALGQKLEDPNTNQARREMGRRQHDAAPRRPYRHSDARSSLTRRAPISSTR
jgi:hypothetical protein